MNITINPGPVNGTITAPPSKSLLQRYVAGALLAEGTSTINCHIHSEDALAAINATKSLGAEVAIDIDKISIKGNPEFRASLKKGTNVHCGESGLCSRLFAPIAALAKESVVISGSGTLQARTMHEMENVLTRAGAVCQLENGCLPARIHGPIVGGDIRIDGSYGSQLLSGMLMALPLADNDSVINVKDLKSRKYIDITIDVLKKFDIEVGNDSYKNFYIPGNQDYKVISTDVEGDWSSAAFLMCAGAVMGEVSVIGLDLPSKQPDREILEILKIAGAEISTRENTITVKRDKLLAFKYDATDTPDLFPPLAALATFCDGVTEIIGIERLLNKESNRAKAIEEEYGKAGADIEIVGNKMIIHGKRPAGGKANSRNDHRIAMGLAILGLGAEKPVIIEDAGCVGKSYPGFFDDLKYIMR